MNPVNQTNAMPSLKPTYGFASTSDLIARFEAKGWQVDKIDVLQPRKQERVGFQRHLVRLNHPDHTSIPGLSNDNKSRPQLILLNSHDGTTALRVFVGLLRIACLNGIIAGTALNDFKAVHSKNIMIKLDNGIDELTEHLPRLFNQVQQLSSAFLTDDQLTKLVLIAVNARLARVNNVHTIRYEDAWQANRPEDTGRDAFTMLNRVQEKVIRGGIRYSYIKFLKDKNGVVVKEVLVNSVTRPLKSIAANVDLNRLIYDAAMTQIA